MQQKAPEKHAIKYAISLAVTLNNNRPVWTVKIEWSAAFVSAGKRMVPINGDKFQSHTSIMDSRSDAIYH